MPRRRVGLLLAAVVAAGWGAVAGWWTPRGPGTTAEALASIGVSLAVGSLAGWVSRSRWAMLLAPVAFAAAVELVRVRLHGPTVDLPALSPYGVVALVTGRGVHGLLTLLPLLVGAGYAAAVARRGRPAGSRLRRYAGRAALGVPAALLALVAVGVAVPARTDAIAGGIAELTTVTAAGREFGLMIRGADPAAPVLLHVSGPPGGSDVGAMRRHLAALEQHYVVVTWDRRGAPRSWGAWAPTADVTLDSEVAATLAVTEHLRERFRRDRIHLMAHSGGTLVAVHAVQRRPELFAAYVGVGQAVSLSASDRRQYDDTLARARARGDTALERRLTDAGPPPFTSFDHGEPLLSSEAGVYDYDRSRNAEGAGGMVESIGVPEYTLLEKAHVIPAILDGWDVLYPRLQDVDLRTQVPELRVPVYLVDGAHEVPSRLTTLAEWYAVLRAPHKERVVLASAGHRSLFEQPGPFVAVLARVRAETAP